MSGRFAQSQTREEYLAYLAMKLIATWHMILSQLDVTTWHPVPKSCC